MKTIAIVEDEFMLRSELKTMLQQANYQVVAIDEFEQTTEQLLFLKPDLVLLDINLPGENGFEICRELKKKSSIPICILTSRDQLKDELQALNLGADEYLMKPFRKERLLARILNVLKRYEGRENLLVRQEFLLDRNTYTIYFNKQSKVLPPNQGKLLEQLLVKEGEAVSKEELCLSLWDTTTYIDENALQVNIARLKKVLKEMAIPYQVQAVRGVGYALLRKE